MGCRADTYFGSLLVAIVSCNRDSAIGIFTGALNLLSTNFVVLYQMRDFYSAAQVGY